MHLGGLRFFFYSLEGQEPPLVHVEQAMSQGFRSPENNRIRALVLQHQPRFLEAWHEHFS